MGTRRNLANATALNSQLRTQLQGALGPLNAELELTQGVKSQLSRTNNENRIRLSSLVQNVFSRPMAEANGGISAVPPLVFVGVAVAAFFFLRGRLL